MELSGQRPQVVSAMLDPRLYAPAPASVDLRETHTSWVFLAGELAYKVKKPVVFPFLDYGTVERRREMCHEEVRLNQRLAPAIYLGVTGIAERAGRYRLTAEDDPDAFEYAVVMRRVDEARTVAALLAGGDLEPGHVDAIGSRLARFHAEVPVAPEDRCGLPVLVETLEENLATLREAGLEILDARRLGAAETFTGSFIAGRGRDFEVRGKAGLVRDCHGDLRAEHVIVPERGDLYVYDCVEFNPALRQIDVAADIAFLAMDLARLGAEPAGLRLIEAYREAGGDPGDDAIGAFFVSYRAWVRAKIACLRALELAAGAEERTAGEAEARDLMALGHRYAWRARRPLLLAITGVSGTGKTTLAKELGELSGWTHTSSDRTRKRLAGLRPSDHGRPEHYTHEMTMRTYAEMGRIARDRLDRDGGAIVDATFHRRDERAAFLEALGSAEARLVLLECTAPRPVLVERTRHREADPRRTSDAGAEVLTRQLAELEAPVEVPATARLRLDTDAPPAELAARVERQLDASIWPSSPTPASARSAST